MSVSPTERFNERVNWSQQVMLLVPCKTKFNPIKTKFYLFNKNTNPAPIGPILQTMGQATGGRLFTTTVKEDYKSCH